MAMMSTEETQDYLYKNNMVKEELIANLVDWTDADEIRLYQGGLEDAAYARLDNPYRPKNAPFDTRDEIRLVDGWQDDGAVGAGRPPPDDLRRRQGQREHRPRAGAEGPADRVLRRRRERASPSSRRSTTSSGSAARPSTRAGCTSPRANTSYDSITNGEYQIPSSILLKPEIQQAVTTTSNVFRVTSVGEVGNARVEIHAVFDFSNDPTGRVVFWKIR